MRQRGEWDREDLRRQLLLQKKLLTTLSERTNSFVPTRRTTRVLHTSHVYYLQGPVRTNKGGGERRVMLTALLTLLCLSQATVSRGQQASPLAGYGLPSLETTDVYVNVFLDRLIDVDVKQYRHESIFLVGLSWRDPRAVGIVEQNRVLMDTQNYTCTVQCWSNVLEGGPCCDGVYAPSFNFANAVGFSQDRQVKQEF